MSEERVPLKLVAAKLGVSRATLWRVTRSSLPDFPAPLKHRGRVYWRSVDLPVLEAAYANFGGRTVFERDRKHEQARTARAAAAAAPKPRRIKAKQSDLRQADLFGEDAPPISDERKMR